MAWNSRELQLLRILLRDVGDLVRCKGLGQVESLVPV